MILLRKDRELPKDPTPPPHAKGELPKDYGEPRAYKSDNVKDEDRDTSTPIKGYLILIITTIVVKREDVKNIPRALKTRSSKRRNSFNLGDLIDKLLISGLSAFPYIISLFKNMNLSFPSEQIILLFLLVIVSVILLLLVIIAFRLLTQKTKHNRIKRARS